MTHRPALLAALTVAAVGCTAPPAAPGVVQARGTLHEAYAGDFLIGAALNERQLRGEDPRGTPIVEAHFNAVTPENAMKWEGIHPAPGVYDWDQSDALVDYAEAHGLSVTGHTLVWHSQTPAWVFEDADGAPLSRDALLARMEEHISTVVGRYRGRIDGWDVVNEALNEDGSLRDSPWFRIIGPDYVAHAFRFARAADPDAALYYNDYSLENSPKRTGAIRLVSGLLSDGVAVTGIATQGHYSLTFPRPAQLDSTLRELAALGEVVISELDVDVLPSPDDSQSADVSRTAEASSALNPYPDGLPATIQRRLADRYAELFRVIHRHRDAVSRVTFWGVTDGDSWRNNWPVQGRTSYPLLFDRAGRPKTAFGAVLRVARTATARP